METVLPVRVKYIGSSPWLTGARKNALKIGQITNTTKIKAYVVTLEIVDDKEVMRIHSFKEHQNDVVEHVPDEIVKDFFKKMVF